MTDYREALNAPARRLMVRGALTLPTGRAVPLSGADVLELTIDEGVDDGMLLGAVLSARHLMKLKSEGGAWLPGGEKLQSDELNGATVQLELGAEGEFRPLCAFVVAEAEGEARSASVTVSGYDSMAEETAGAFADNLAYPATLLQIVRHIVGKTRYPLPSSVPNGGAVVSKRPGWGTLSVRQALGYALALAGAFARVNRAGAMEILPVYRPGAPVSEIGAAAVLKRVHAFSDFGPLNALRGTSARGEDGEGEIAEIEAVADPSKPVASWNALDLGANPLLVAGTAGAENLLRGALNAMAGMELCRASFRFRGDPTLLIGDGVLIDGARSVLTRQKLTLSRGFSAECELGAPDTGQNALRAITPEGALNAARLTGTVDGGLLAAESVTAGAIRAGSVTAGKLAAGSVTAEKLAAGSVTAGKLDAATVDARVATIARAEIAAAEIDGARIADASILTAKIQDAAITGAKIGTAAVGTAKIALGAITAALIANGAIGTAQIADASITSAKVVDLNADAITAGTLSVERLLLRGADGLFLAINATDEGLTAQQLSEEEYENRISGTVLVAKSVTAAKIAAETITGNEIAANAITSDKLDVQELFAAEAVIDHLNTYDVRNDDRIALTVGGVRKTYLRVVEGGVEIGIDGGDYKAFIAGDRYDIRQGSRPIASFAYNRMWAQAAEISDYLRLGDMPIWLSPEGNLCID
ncbi:MAG: hypothetical protein GX647_06210 [Clostridiales bacterium]|nr:hypothetical protein [Clostridiales bacterium]OPZ67259.1 MAG: hypothetical protein BWY81_01409 [Firmicutes bacterium ADurb.Bin467]